MGRELKRVPLDFDWPLNKPYEGFINPHYAKRIQCPFCEHGFSPEYKYLETRWYGYERGGFTPEQRGSVPLTPDTPAVRAFAERNVGRTPSFYGSGEKAVRREAERLCALWNPSWCHHLNELDVAALLKADRLWDFTRVPRTPKQIALVKRRVASGKHNSWLPKSNGYVPTPAEVNEWSLNGFGHDSGNAYICIKAECKRLGYPVTCAHCKGRGHTWPDKKTKWHYDHWKRKEPPTGEGYQIWETVSEGSPISPVFATPEELASHMTTTRWGGDTGTSYEKWLAFIRGPGWAPSMVIQDGKIMDGVEAVSS